MKWAMGHSKELKGTFIGNTLNRIFKVLSENSGYKLDAYEACMLRSFILSSDNSYMLNPNYQGEYAPQGAPAFREGIVIKHPAHRLNYCSESVTACFMRMLADRAKVPI